MLIRFIAWTVASLVFGAADIRARAEHPVPDGPLWLTYAGENGPGKGKHIVLIAGDQEYRSEYALPMLAKVLAKRHGFDCTVLFNMNDRNEVDPTVKIRWEDKTVTHNVPGMEFLDKADLVVVFTRLMSLPDAQMQHLYEYLDSGKPIIALRTGNHGFLSFDYRKDGKRIDFGNDVLGGSFRNHHGRWQQDSTRGILDEANKNHPVLKGVTDIWGLTDVYRTYKEGGSLPADCTPLVLGQPLMGRNHDDPINPKLVALPVAWVKTWTGNAGKAARVFNTTMGSAEDYRNLGVRRMTVNAVYWCLGMEMQIDPASDVEPVGVYEPLRGGFDYARLKVLPRPVAFYK
jgi:hypothetical protein